MKSKLWKPQHILYFLHQSCQEYMGNEQEKFRVSKSYGTGHSATLFLID